MLNDVNKGEIMCRCEEHDKFVYMVYDLELEKYIDYKGKIYLTEQEAFILRTNYRCYNVETRKFKLVEEMK